MGEQDREVLSIIRIPSQNLIIGQLSQQVKGGHSSVGKEEKVVSFEKIPSHLPPAPAQRKNS